MHTNHLGSTTMVTDPTGAVSQKVLFYPYGQRVATVRVFLTVGFPVDYEPTVNSNRELTVVTSSGCRRVLWKQARSASITATAYHELRHVLLGDFGRSALKAKHGDPTVEAETTQAETEALENEGLE